MVYVLQGVSWNLATLTSPGILGRVGLQRKQTLVGGAYPLPCQPQQLQVMGLQVVLHHQRKTGTVIEVSVIMQETHMALLYSPLRKLGCPSSNYN